MHRKLCIMQANCQGDELEPLLLASPAFAGTYKLARYTNYAREHVPAEQLAACAVFLYQHLGDGWGDLSSAILTGQLSASAVALQIPNMLFKGYWPFWVSGGPIAFSDTLLNRLIEEGAPKAAIVTIYLNGDIRAFINLQEALEETIATERRKEAGSCVQTVDFILTHWKNRRMFYTVNHPGKELLVHVAQGILASLDLPPLTEADLTAVAARGIFPSYADFELPIHPQVAAFHNLDFGGPDHIYTVFGRPMTFAQYISRYIDCRLNGFEKDFVSYLQLV